MKIPLKKKNISLSPWQVWFAYVEFDGSNGGKKRPVLVTEVKGTDCSVMEITSQPFAYITDIPIADLYSAGLNQKSVIQTRKRRVLRRGSLIEYRGKLSYEDINNVKRAWRFS
ncbi:MAG: type II toxin-antitoxin system PemK/MazF family toxin [Methanosarcinales archaeon]|jgi:mRNA-degrading endonuclease toxin of MazEF toxin-antitoxin module|nr:type II toxin-antitoxin system PemK/MazF family toxin [Methanosarcinales archaeon]